MGGQLEPKWRFEKGCGVCDGEDVPWFRLVGGGDLSFDGGSTVEFAEFCVAGMVA